MIPAWPPALRPRGVHSLCRPRSIIEVAAVVEDSRPLLALIALWIVLSISLAGTAFRVDEPNILAVARQIAAHPSDPYGFSINWLGHLEPASKILANPPIVPYWLALWGARFGWREVPLHLAMLPFGIVSLLAMASLARRWGVSPSLAAGMLLLSPGFLIGSQVVMPDVAMLSLLLLTMAAAMKWLEEGTTAALATMICAAAITPFMKYNGVIVVPLLALLAIVHPRRRWSLAAAAVAPVLMLAVWAWLSRSMYGQSHFGASAQLQQISGGDLMTGSLSVIGLGILPLPLASYRRPSEMRKSWDVALSAGVASISFLAALSILGYPLVSAMLFACACSIAVRFLLFVMISGIRSLFLRDWRTGLLFLWVAGVLALQSRLIFTSVRYLLPILPAAILLLLPRAAIVKMESQRSRVVQLVLGASLFLTTLIMLGVAQTANVARAYVQEVVRPAAARNRGRLLFAGHWGFQWYMERAGGVAVEAGTGPVLGSGDLLVVAHTPFPQLDRDPPGAAIRKSSTSYRIALPVHTIDCWANANFYSNGIGRCRRPASVAYLPWGVSTSPVEEFDLYSVSPVSPLIRSHRADDRPR